MGILDEDFARRNLKNVVLTNLIWVFPIVLLVSFATGHGSRLRTFLALSVMVYAPILIWLALFLFRIRNERHAFLSWVCILVAWLALFALNSVRAMLYDFVDFILGEAT